MARPAKRTLIALVAALAGCARDRAGAAPNADAKSSSSTSASSPGSSSGSTPASSPIVVPASVASSSDRRPFVLFLHGFGSSGAAMTGELGLARLAAERRFSYAAPDGARNGRGQRFWNASRACCDFEASAPGHVAELRALLREAAEHPRVDPSRLYAIGLSNGGFMAQRLACDAPELRGFVSVAGGAPGEGEPCARTTKIRALQVHGDADDVVRFDGGVTVDDVERLLKGAPFPAAARGRHPGAVETIARWGAVNGCRGELGPAVPAATLPIAGLERRAFAGCAAPVELWIARGGDHFAAMRPAAQGALVSFLIDEPR